MWLQAVCQERSTVGKGISNTLFVANCAFLTEKDHKLKYSEEYRFFTDLNISLRRRSKYLQKSVHGMLKASKAGSSVGGSASTFFSIIGLSKRFSRMTNDIVLPHALLRRISLR